MSKLHFPFSNFGGWDGHRWRLLSVPWWPTPLWIILKTSNESCCFFFFSLSLCYRIFWFNGQNPVTIKIKRLTECTIKSIQLILCAKTTRRLWVMVAWSTTHLWCGYTFIQVCQHILKYPETDISINFKRCIKACRLTRNSPGKDARGSAWFASLSGHSSLRCVPHT